MADRQESPYQMPIAPGPSWNVPRISLPRCLGLLLEYQVEWWYYAGHAYDTDGMEYSLQFSIVRDAIDGRNPELQLVACTSGIGWDETYLWNPGYGIGVSEGHSLLPCALTIQKVTDDAYEGSFHSLIAPIRTRFFRTGGASSGAKGSEYTLVSSATGDSAYEIEMQLVDERGMIMEWQSAFIGPEQPGSEPFTASSYEFAQPRLRITGGTLTAGGSQRVLNGGMLWLDRQVLTYPPKSHDKAATGTGDPLHDAIAASRFGDQLYRGSWMGITLDDGLSMALSCMWQPPPTPPPLRLQWQTGTLLGLPPLTTYGNLYFNEDGRRVRNGGSYLRGFEKGDPDPDEFDFDLNILRPDDPDASPHWTSPASGRTYSSGWLLRIGALGQQHGLPAKLYLKAVVPSTENHLPGKNDFWEGAANVYKDADLSEKIGHAFVEQMGFN